MWTHNARGWLPEPATHMELLMWRFVSIFNVNRFLQFILGEEQVGGCDWDLEEEVRRTTGGEGGTGAADTDAGSEASRQCKYKHTGGEASWQCKYKHAGGEASRQCKDQPQIIAILVNLAYETQLKCSCGIIVFMLLIVLPCNTLQFYFEQFYSKW